MDINNISKEDLQKLSDNKIALFGLSCVDRILPLYKNFEKEISTEAEEYFTIFKDGYTLLNTLLNTAFDMVLDKNIIKKNLLGYQEDCLSVAPDTEEISSTFAVISQNCAISLSYIFQFLSDKNIQNILYCRNKVTETIDIISFSKNENENELNSRFINESIVEKTIFKLIDELVEPLMKNDISKLQEFNKKNVISI